MPFQKGKPRHPKAGRKAGVPNKATVEVKLAIERVYAGLGGDEAFLDWARGNPTEFYRGMLTKLLPKDLNVNVGGAVRLNVRFIVDPNRSRPGGESAAVPPVPEPG